MVLGALLGGASALVDIGTRVADQGIATPRRALALLVLAAVALAVAAPGAIGALRRSPRGPERRLVAAGFVAFDWYVTAVWWRWRRDALLAVPSAAIAATALVSVVLLVTSASSAARTQVRVRRVGRGQGD